MTPEERHAFLSARKGIGSSDVPAILGVSKWATAGDIYDKIIERLEGRVPFVQETTLDQQRGIDLEELASRKWCEAHGRPRDSIRRQKQRAHKQYPWMLANVDRQILSSNGEGPAILEIKCPRSQTMYRIRDEGAPDDYMIQIQHQFAVMGEDYTKAWLCVYHPDFEMMEQRIERDDEFINETLIPSLKSFWFDHVEPRNPPVSSEEQHYEGPKLEAGRMNFDDSSEFKELVENKRSSSQYLRSIREADNINTKALRVYMEEKGFSAAQGSGAKVTFFSVKPRAKWNLQKVEKTLTELGRDLDEFRTFGNPRTQLRFTVNKN